MKPNNALYSDAPRLFRSLGAGERTANGASLSFAPFDPKNEKMKKRLRKKKHYREFTEWGRQLIIIRNRKDAFDEFLEAFVEEAIEANGCYCGGGGKEDKLDVVVELGRRSDDPTARLNKITAWLDARPDVQSWRTGDEFDIWRGNFHDIEDKIEQTAAADRQ